MKSFFSRYGRSILTVLAAFSVGALLCATLWPFTPYPTNEVSWVGTEDGVRFGDYATMFSAGEFTAVPGAEKEPFSLELWMRPGLTKDTNVMVAFYTPENPWEFTIRQDESDVNVLHANSKARGAKALLVGEVIARGRDTLVTVTAAPGATTIYINGKARKVSHNFGLSRKDLSGEMVIGNSPIGNNSWSGTLRGLAIYKKSLSAQEAASHYAAWSANHGDTVNREEMLALYLFRERSGAVAKNEIAGGVDLNIPRHYTIWHQAFMTAPWEEFQPSAMYVKDLIVNIAGFVPLGLVLYPYFYVVRGSKRPWLMSYLSGALLSLSIEILQAFEPTRYSGWTDVITNSSGAALGASVYLWSAAQKLLTNIFGSRETQKAA